MRKASKKPQWQKTIAKERIKILFSLASREFSEHPERSNRYVELARKIGKRYNIKISGEYRRRFCRKCLHYLRPGINSKVRTRSTQGALIIECLDCGNISRYPYRKEKSSI